MIKKFKNILSALTLLCVFLFINFFISLSLNIAGAQVTSFSDLVGDQHLEGRKVIDTSSNKYVFGNVALTRAEATSV